MVVSVFVAAGRGEGGAGVVVGGAGAGVATGDTTVLVGNGADNLFFFGLPTISKHYSILSYFYSNK